MRRYKAACFQFAWSRIIAAMSNDKFRELCEQVLIPYLGNFMHRQLIELYRSFDQLTAEVQRIGRRVDWIATRVDALQSHEGDG